MGVGELIVVLGIRRNCCIWSDFFLLWKLYLLVTGRKGTTPFHVSMTKASSLEVPEVGGLVEGEGGGKYHFWGGPRKANCHHELQRGVRRRGQGRWSREESVWLKVKPVLWPRWQLVGPWGQAIMKATYDVYLSDVYLTGRKMHNSNKPTTPTPSFSLYIGLPLILNNYSRDVCTSASQMACVRSRKRERGTINAQLVWAILDTCSVVSHTLKAPIFLGCL